MARYVKYVGTSGQRLITARDWERAGMEGQKSVSWDRTNGWTVDIEELSDDAQSAIMSELEMVEVSGAVAEMEKDSARRMPRDQRTRTLEQRTRTEEPSPREFSGMVQDNVNEATEDMPREASAQTTREGKTTTAKGETTDESGKPIKGNGTK